MYVPGTKKITDYSKDITKSVQDKYKTPIPEALIKDILKTFEQNLHDYMILKSKQPNKESTGIKYHFKLSLRLLTTGHHSNILYFLYHTRK